jgi:hypothetical protein
MEVLSHRFQPEQRQPNEPEQHERRTGDTREQAVEEREGGAGLDDAEVVGPGGRQHVVLREEPAVYRIGQQRDGQMDAEEQRDQRVEGRAPPRRRPKLRRAGNDLPPAVQPPEDSAQRGQRQGEADRNHPAGVKEIVDLRRQRRPGVEPFLVGERQGAGDGHAWAKGRNAGRNDTLGS